MEKNRDSHFSQNRPALLSTIPWWDRAADAANGSPPCAQGRSGTEGPLCPRPSDCLTGRSGVGEAYLPPPALPPLIGMSMTELNHQCALNYIMHTLDSGL